MAKPKICPNCGLINTPEAQRCDCGWDFESQLQEQSYLDPKKMRLPVSVGIGGGLVAALFIARIIIRLLSTAANRGF